MKKIFTEFCRETSLHGWALVAKKSIPSFHCIFWTFTIFSTLSLGIVLITTNTNEFLNATVDFTTLSKTTSMNEVFFPAIYIINKNLARKSIVESFFLARDPGDHEDRKAKMTKAFDSFVSFNKLKRPMDQYPKLYHNHSVQFKKPDELTLELQKFLTELSYDSLGIENIGTHMDLNGLLVHLEFWRGEGVTHIGGTYADNYFSPKNRFIPFFQKPGDIDYLRSYQPKAISGRDSGIKLWIDAEVFDYMVLPFFQEIVQEYFDSRGFIAGISHPFDFDLSEFHGIHIEPGQEVDIQVSTELIITPDEQDMKFRFDPDTRKCYFEDEVQLAHFPAWWYRFSMTNCLVEAQIQKLEEICKCTPPHAPIAHYDICQADTSYWKCLTENYVDIGQVTRFKQDEQMLECYTNCNDQPYDFTFTATKFSLRKDGWKLCLVIQKILRTCQSFKRVTLNESYPGICEGLAVFDNEHLNCYENFHLFKENATDHGIQLVKKYIDENIARVNVYMKDPFAPKIARSVKISYSSFLSNIGGLMGLFQGFSVISLVEILFFVFQCIKSKLSSMRLCMQEE